MLSDRRYLSANVTVLLQGRGNAAPWRANNTACLETYKVSPLCFFLCGMLYPCILLVTVEMYLCMHAHGRGKLHTLNRCTPTNSCSSCCEFSNIMSLCNHYLICKAVHPPADLRIVLDPKFSQLSWLNSAALCLPSAEAVSKLHGLNALSLGCMCGLT